MGDGGRTGLEQYQPGLIGGMTGRILFMSEERFAKDICEGTCFAKNIGPSYACKVPALLA